MARNAKRAVQLVVIVDVAIHASAWWHGMRSSQRETGLRMIEFPIRPLHGVMALFASRRETRMRHRAVRVIEIGLVAADARSRQTGVVVVDVAVRARSRRHSVRTGQREGRVVVIEGRIRPGGGVMAHLASRGEAGVWHGTVRSREIFLMARNAGRSGDVVIVVDVTIGASARRDGMQTGQRETGLRVIELGIRPLDRVVTLLAGGGEAGVRHRSLRIVEVVLVTRNTSGNGDGVIVVDVAVGASPRRHRMGANQRKSGLRVIEFAIRPLDRVVALLAGCREAGVRHRTGRTAEILLMARNARSVRDAEVVIDVAVRALPWGHGVRSGQWKRGFRVVETSRLPCRSRVA